MAVCGRCGSTDVAWAINYEGEGYNYLADVVDGEKVGHHADTCRFYRNHDKKVREAMRKRQEKKRS